MLSVPDQFWSNCKANPLIPMMLGICMGGSLYISVKGILLAFSAVTTLYKVIGAVQFIGSVYAFSGAMLLADRTLIKFSSAQNLRDEGWSPIYTVPLMIWVTPIFYCLNVHPYNH